MFSGGQQNENVSLLPDNPGIRIEAVQGGGGKSSRRGWVSEPLEIKDASEFNLPLNLGTLKKYQTRWRQTLGPNIPSRKKPRQDPHIIIGSLNIFECPTYVVAPLRGDAEGASMVFSWTDKLLSKSAELHVVFVGPLCGREPNKFIENGLTSLLTKYPGHVIYVSEKENGLPSLDGLLLNALPETSKQVAIGFVPDHENVYHRSSRELHCLRVDTLKVPFSKAGEEDKDCSIHYLKFDIPSRVEAQEKDFENKSLSGNISFKAPPGWVTRVSFEHSRIEQEGGDTTIKPSGIAISGEVEVSLGDSKRFKIRRDAKAAWEKGEFTDEELALLQSEGLQYSNPIYAKFFEGLISNQCNSEPDTQLNPDCEIFRYIMADRYYRQVKAMKEGKKAMKVGDSTGDSSSGTKTPEDVEPSGAGPDAPGAGPGAGPDAPGAGTGPDAPGTGADPSSSLAPGSGAPDPGASGPGPDPSTSLIPGTGSPTPSPVPARPVTGKITDRVTDADTASYIERVVSEAEKATKKKWFGKDLDKSLKDILALRNAELEKANETYKTTDIAVKKCEKKLYNNAVTFFTNYDRFKQYGDKVREFLETQLDKVTIANDEETSLKYRTMLRIIQRDLNITGKIETIPGEDDNIRNLVIPVITGLKAIQVSLYTAVYGPIALAHDALKFSAATVIMSGSGGFKGTKFILTNPLRILKAAVKVAIAPVVIGAAGVAATAVTLFQIGKKLTEVELLVNQSESWYRLAGNSVTIDIVNAYKEVTSVYNLLNIIKGSLSKTDDTVAGAPITTLKSDIDAAIEKTMAMKNTLRGYSGRISDRMTVMIEAGKDYFSEMFNNFADNVKINNLETITTFKTKRSEMISSLSELVKEKITYMKCFAQNMNLRAIQVYKVAELEVKFKKAELEYNRNVSEIISDALIKSGTGDDEYSGIDATANAHIGKTRAPDYVSVASIEQNASTEVKRHIVDITNELHEVEDKFSHIQEIKFIIQNGIDKIDEEDNSSFSNQVVKNVLCKAFNDMNTGLTHKSNELMEVTDTDIGGYLNYMGNININSIFVTEAINSCIGVTPVPPGSGPPGSGPLRIRTPTPTPTPTPSPTPSPSPSPTPPTPTPTPPTPTPPTPTPPTPTPPRPTPPPGSGPTVDNGEVVIPLIPLNPIQDRTFYDKLNPVSSYTQYSELYNNLTHLRIPFNEYRLVYMNYLTSTQATRDRTVTALQVRLNNIRNIPNIEPELVELIRAVKADLKTGGTVLKPSLLRLNIHLNSYNIAIINNVTRIFNEENTKFSDKLKRIQLVAKTTKMTGGMFCRNRTRSKRNRKNNTMKLRFIY